VLAAKLRGGLTKGAVSVLNVFDGPPVTAEAKLTRSWCRLAKSALERQKQLDNVTLVVCTDRKNKEQRAIRVFSEGELPRPLI
ncbi:hypothetical protein BaRGS_00040566, partial [Batillaria attramentaria]